jgi:hypothetical protein
LAGYLRFIRHKSSPPRFRDFDLLRREALGSVVAFDAKKMLEQNGLNESHIGSFEYGPRGLDAPLMGFLSREELHSRRQIPVSCLD